jgi:hypothetical protein
VVDETLILSGFLVGATRHEIYQLRDWLLQSQQCIIQTIRMSDQVTATNLRRFLYKKENVNHHIQALCLRQDIRLDYQIQLDLSVDDVDSCISILDEVQKHPEVKTLVLHGHLAVNQLERVLSKLTTLLRCNDRDWTSVQVLTGFLPSDDQPHDAWRATMEHYMEVFSQLYTQYNLPIDIRPAP